MTLGASLFLIGRRRDPALRGDGRRSPGIDIQVVGTILMVIGVLGFAHLAVPVPVGAAQRDAAATAALLSAQDRRAPDSARRSGRARRDAARQHDPGGP